MHAQHFEPRISLTFEKFCVFVLKAVRLLLEERPPPTHPNPNSAIPPELPVCHLSAHRRARIRALSHVFEWSCSHCGSRQKEPRRLSCSRAEMPPSRERGCWSLSDVNPFVAHAPGRLTRPASLEATRSRGMRTRTKNIERIARPLAARVLDIVSHIQRLSRLEFLLR